MRRTLSILPVVTTLLLGACETATAPSEADGEPQGSPLPVGTDFTPGGEALLTSSAADAWPELEGHHVAWYRTAPAEEEGLWVLDLVTGNASRVWAGSILSAFDMKGQDIFWGSENGLHTYDIATGSLETLAGGYRNYRDVSAGPRYVVGTATQSSDRPFVYDRATGTESLIPTPTAVPATRGWEDYVLWTDHREALSVREFYLYHIPTGTEAAITDQTQRLTSENAAISDNRVVYFARRFCPGPLQLYDMVTGATSTVPLPASVTCPQVVELQGSLLVYRHSAGGGVVNLGFQDLGSGESLEMAVNDPGNGRVDADLDGTRVVHTSAQGLRLLDLRFQPPEPPVADAGGPYEILEGSLLTLDGTESSSPSGLPLRYRWEMGDGTVLEGTPTPTHGWADDGEYTILLTVSEEGGSSADAETAARVLNGAPVVAVEGSASATVRALTRGLRGEVGLPVTLHATFSDPGLLDAPWRWWVSWDGGELASGTVDQQGSLPEVTWVPGSPGVFTLSVRVQDKDGGVSEARIPLTVDAPEPLEIPIRAGTGAQHSVPSPTSNGVFPVVVFGTDELAIADMDLSAFRLGPEGAMALSAGGHAPRASDVDGDGRADLVLTFRAGEVGLAPGYTELCLAGATAAGDPLQGCDAVRVAGAGNGE